MFGRETRKPALPARIHERTAFPNSLVPFTDVDGSARLWQRDPEGMRSALVKLENALLMAVEAIRCALLKTNRAVHCTSYRLS